ncbi:acyl-CoA dehydrogenase family protein [Jatrophihabitans sp.]|uniref:acyl-CoA dehydrogenase family protein n=1 Tax=Jatrophihabitans sp. TaxID=1932789 RepID=UPI0030C6DD53|nr:acyl-CoA dehydrogenase [Jatrophihabitans sp.]
MRRRIDRFSTTAATIAAEVAAPVADQVDAEGRFPKESLDALRSAELLSAYVPTEFGGGGASLAELGSVVATLARSCASTAMVFAMHQIQVASLVRHGDNPELRDYLRHEVVGRQALLASATTEQGIGGDVRSSSCAVEESGAGFHLTKQSPVISYGEHADAVLVTARRTADSPPGDQVLVLCARPGLDLEPVSDWDALGMRGTCSRGFVLRAEGPAWAVLPSAYAEISSRTMLPVSHILWAHLWWGIAEQATAQAHAVVRAEGRRKIGTTPPSAVRLAELMAALLPFEAMVTRAAEHFDGLAPESEELASMRYAIDANSLKIAASTSVVDIVNRALPICGMAGYREDSQFRLGRLLRDAHSAEVMIGNDRILANSAQLLLMVRDR